MEAPQHLGLRHLALSVTALSDCLHFYSTLLGMKIVWQPDEDNIYLSSGNDNLALHRAPVNAAPSPHQRLDHLGFFVARPEDVDAWYQFLSEQHIEMKAGPKNHRDGTRSFYCADPDGNVVQFIFCPPAILITQHPQSV